MLNINSWISFLPETDRINPFTFDLIEHHFDKLNQLFLLLEIDLTQSTYCNNNGLVMVENFGELFGWKVDSHLSVLLKSDYQHFTDLVLQTFIQKRFSINDGLLLIRIQSTFFPIYTIFIILIMIIVIL